MTFIEFLHVNPLLETLWRSQEFGHEFFGSNCHVDNSHFLQRQARAPFVIFSKDTSNNTLEVCYHASFGCFEPRQRQYSYKHSANVLKTVMFVCGHVGKAL